MLTVDYWKKAEPEIFKMKYIYWWFIIMIMIMIIIIHNICKVHNTKVSKCLDLITQLRFLV